MMSLLSVMLRYLKAYLQLGSFHINNEERNTMLALGLSYVRDEKVRGNYFEFGVASGRTFIASILLSKKMMVDIDFIALDSFQGFPQPSRVDAARFERFKKGEENWPKTHLLSNLRRAGIDLARVEIVEGWFAESLTSDLQRRHVAKGGCALAWIDCDMYVSTVPVLDFLTPLIHQGSILIFDDWFCYRGSPDQGEQRAVREWLARHPELELIPFRKFAVVGSSFIVNIRDGDGLKRDGGSQKDD